MHDPPTGTRADGPPTDPVTAEPWSPVRGFVPPDPDEPPPVELWRVVGDVPPWGSVLLLLSWAVLFARSVTRHELGDVAALIAHGASVTEPLTAADAWRLLASTFLHLDLAHLFFNSVSMVVFGPAVERIFGRWTFWIVFVLGGLAASLSSLAWRLARDAGATHVSLGASGALFALAGALLSGAWRLRRRLAIGRARALAAAVLFFSVPAIAQGFQRVGTDNAAHVGGMASGLALGAMVPLSPRLGGPAAHVAWRVLATLAAIALSAAFVHALLGG